LGPAGPPGDFETIARRHAALPATQEKMPLQLSATLGGDFSGVVEAVGPGIASWRQGLRTGAADRWRFGVNGLTNPFAAANAKSIDDLLAG